MRYKRDLVTPFVSVHREAWGNTARSCSVEFRKEKSELWGGKPLEKQGGEQVMFILSVEYSVDQDSLHSQYRPYQRPISNLSR